ncbi:MAG: hypothetical protein K8S14_02420 [Actinomycetia bacterium]|nr:hypothetical protein [Actinomycetes bacterium]
MPWIIEVKYHKKYSKIKKIMISNLIYNYYNPCKFIYNKSKYELPEHVKKEIKENWQDLFNSGERFINGDLFTVNNILIGEDKILNFNVIKTNYAHYLYSMKNNFTEDHICRSVAANVLPLTSDNYFILGAMAENTSLPNKIKFIGGAMSEDDLCGDFLEPLKCVTRETREEIGLDLGNHPHILKLEPRYLITRKNWFFINTLYYAQLNISKGELIKMFDEHKIYLQKKNEVELDSILFINNEKKDIESFLNENERRLIDYLEEFFFVLIGKLDANDIVKRVNSFNFNRGK